MDQDESVDDPVEDAALLDDSCEIKRDSICVFTSEMMLHSPLRVTPTQFFVLPLIRRSLSSWQQVVKMIKPICCKLIMNKSIAYVWKAIKTVSAVLHSMSPETILPQLI